MDRNSAIGLTLIAVLLLVYFNFFAPSPIPEETKPAKIETKEATRKDSSKVESSAAIDSTLIKQYGNLSSFLTGMEEITTVENDQVRYKFSNTGVIKEVELKNFKTYNQTPLFLASNNDNIFSLLTQYEGKEVDLYRLFYKVETSKKADTTILTYTAQVSENAYLRHVYAIPPAGYTIDYRIESQGLTLGGKSLIYRWSDQIPLQEKDIKDSRSRTTINYYLSNENFDGISESATDAKTETLEGGIKWVAIKQKFFVSSFIAKNSFSAGEIKTAADLNNEKVVKSADVQLFIPLEDLQLHKTKYSYYFGPNEYDILKTVTPSFSRNLYLGWPPVIWVNKFVILPIFKFLQTYISNYGIIIVLLVFFIKLLLTPLSYRSYLGMAKMKLLKPELDIIKEKNGDNMAQAQQDQMKLYQQAGVNPFSGCIPLLLQMPIMFAMLYLFPASIELRQKPFLWAEDLSTYDSIIHLPFTVPFGFGDHVSLFVLLMTASTIVYQWQNNQMQTVQGPMKTMSYIMPIVFLFILNSFSAALSFYYFVSNLVTFAQQAIIKRFVDEDKIKAIMEENRKKAATGTGKKSKFMSKLEEAMKVSEEARKKGKK